MGVASWLAIGLEGRCWEVLEGEGVQN